MLGTCHAAAKAKAFSCRLEQILSKHGGVVATVVDSGTFVEILIALRARIVHVPVGIHHIPLAEDTLEAAMHHCAPQHLPELWDTRPAVVAQTRATHLATLFPFPLSSIVQRPVNLCWHVIHLQGQEALADKVGHLLVRKQSWLAVQPRSAGVGQLRERSNIAQRGRVWSQEVARELSQPPHPCFVQP